MEWRPVGQRIYGSENAMERKWAMGCISLNRPRLENLAKVLPLSAPCIVNMVADAVDREMAEARYDSKQQQKKKPVEKATQLATERSRKHPRTITERPVRFRTLCQDHTGTKPRRTNTSLFSYSESKHMGYSCNHQSVFWGGAGPDRPSALRKLSRVSFTWPYGIPLSLPKLTIFPTIKPCIRFPTPPPPPLNTASGKNTGIPLSSLQSFPVCQISFSAFFSLLSVASSRDSPSVLLLADR